MVEWAAIFRRYGPASRAELRRPYATKPPGSSGGHCTMPD